MMAAEPRRHEGQRPYSAGDGARRHPLSGEPPPPPFRRDSSLERGVIGAPPPLVRASDHLFTAAEVESLLAVREKELLSVKRRLHRASKKNDALESTVTVLKEGGSELRRTVEEGTAKQDELQLRVSELEDFVKRKSAALKTSNHRREKAEETVKVETAQARVAAELARSALEDSARKGFSLRERAQDAETRVKSLECRLEVSAVQATEAKRMAAKELDGRVLAHERDRVGQETAISAAEEENRSLREKLANALEGVRQKQEAERQTDRVVRELQAWRERVANGDVVEMSSSEAKRLRWSEEQAELMKEANANLRSQLLESGKLLAEAEHSFKTVTAGFGDATGTIAGLSARLDQKSKGLLKAERELRTSRAEASRLKKHVTSLQIGLCGEQRRVRGRERALDSTRRAMEALVRARQEEVEAKFREVEKRRTAERSSANTASEKESLRLRAEAAEECSREMDAERRVLLQHVAVAREEAALLRSKTREDLSPSKIRATPGAAPSAPTSTAVFSDSRSSMNPVGWRETIRTLLERAVSDWSVKSLFRPASTPTTGRKDRSKGKLPGRSSAEESSSDSVSEDTPGEALLPKTPTGAEAPATETIYHLAAAAGHGSAGGRKARLHRSRESGYLGDTTDVSRPLEVVRVYGAPEKQGSNRSAGWRWDLALPSGAREDSHGTGEILAALGLRTLGRSLRARGVRGEGARMALNAVARLLDALLLTRSLAAQQCAQVRTELALALGRLSTRSSLVSNTRSAARQASTCNRTLLLRLVDLELQRWRDRATASAASENREGMEPTLDRKGEDDGHESEGEDLDTDLEANGDTGSSAGEQRLDLPPLKKAGLGENQTPTHPLGMKGAVLNLSNVGVDDETLGQVVRKILRTCTPESHQPRSTPGEDRLGHEGSSKVNAVVPLARLLLRGNNITDAGALALIPLVRESPHVTELDLRDNAIGNNGKLALKKALTCSPWVHRVVSEDLCGNVEEGKGVGGLVLRGKRRPLSTAIERARAYAFERIPSPSSEAPSRLDALHSRTGRQRKREDTTGTSYDRAPAYGGPAGCVSPGKDETRNKGGEKKPLRLMQPPALENPTRTPFTFVSPSCVIDFRGCARRPLVLPLTSTEDSDSRDPSPTLTQGKSSRDDKRRARQHRGSPNTPTTQGRLDSGKTGGRAVHSTPQQAGAESTDLHGAVGEPLRRLRHTRRPNSADRDGGCQHPLNSEAQDEDGLALLLNVSRRIFNRAEGFEHTANPGEARCASRTPVWTQYPGCVELSQEQSAEISKPSESRAPVLSEAPNEPTLLPPPVDRDYSPPPRPHRGARWRRTPRRHKRSSAVGKHPDRMLKPSQEHSALDEQPAIETPPTLVRGAEALEVHDKEQRDSPMNGHLVRKNDPTSPQAPEDGDAALQPAGVSTPLPPVARKNSVVVEDAAIWDEAQQSSDNNGWAYDETTSSWYAAGTSATATASAGIGDEQTYSDQGWRFDEQSATWHQDESVWQGHGQHEPLCNEASEHAAVTSNVLGDQGVPGDSCVEHVGVPVDERAGATCAMLPGQGIERENMEIEEAGGLLAKRIKALELALENRRDS